MDCPVCGTKTKVLRTRSHPNVNFRVRQCEKRGCFYSYSTREVKIDPNNEENEQKSGISTR